MATCKTYNFTNRQNISNEQSLINNYAVELVNMYGVEVSYFTNGYKLSSHDFLYGENLSEPYFNPIKMTALAEMSEDTLILSKIGIMCNADLTLVIPIQTFTQTFSSYGQYPSPKAGDLVRLDVLGYDRPGGGFESYTTINDQLALSSLKLCKNPEEYQNALNILIEQNQINKDNWLRGAPVFEVTERRDQNINRNINKLGFTNLWLVYAKRYDYSFELNAPIEQGSTQVSDESFVGLLSGNTSPKSKDKTYTQNAQDASKKIWDYSQHGQLDKTYGNY